MTEGGATLGGREKLRIPVDGQKNDRLYWYISGEDSEKQQGGGDRRRKSTVLLSLPVQESKKSKRIVAD